MGRIRVFSFIVTSVDQRETKANELGRRSAVIGED